jgi:UDP-N-acetyl-D-glucosamine dehydrogenase
MRAHAFDLESLPLTAELLASQDCVIVATDHDAFDYALIAAHAPLVVDTRGRYPAAAENIIKA